MGEVFKSKVKKFDFEKFKVDLEKRPKVMRTTEDTLKDLIPNWNVNFFKKKIRDTFIINEEEDF